MRWTSSLALPLAMLGLLGWLSGCTVPPLMHRGGIMVDSWADVKVDNATAAGILASFDRAEAGLQAGNLDEVMSLYSEEYSYHGLAKQELRKLWGELLQQHREFRSNHILSRFVSVPGEPQTVEVTCTESLWAVSKETGEQVSIDSWYGEVHHMVNENGTWRVRGHRGKAPKTQAFGAAPHPFF
ncbi:MAG: hypothetical protein FJ245_04075 [Nitrospira sp.]|nr:hypothetical protein [Nitrospira sp.]